MKQTTVHAAVPTQRSTAFDYRAASSELLIEVLSLVERCEPVAMLGPRASGKQVFLSRIAQAGEIGSVAVHLRCESFVEDPGGFGRAIIEKLREELRERGLPTTDTSCVWEDVLENCLRDHPIRITLLIANVDVLASSLARRLLKTLRKLNHVRAQCTGKLAVVITGSYDLAPLVYGRDSEFAIAKQLVLQGFDQEWFYDFMVQYAAVSGLEIENPGKDRLFELTGGDVLLLRLVFETLLDGRRLHRIERGHVTLQEVDCVAESIRSRLSISSDVLLRAFSRAASSATSLQLLEELLTSVDGRCSLPASHDFADLLLRESVPTDLELCGIARRQSNRLVWASPLVRILATQYFSWWTMGDSFACCGEWQRAFAHYQKAYDEKVPVTLSASQRPSLNSAISAFGTELSRLAGLATTSLHHFCSFFSNGLHALLGVDEVTFWQFDDLSRNWQRQRFDDHLLDLPTEPTTKVELAVSSESLEPPEFLELGVNEISGPERAFGLVVKIPVHQGGEKCLVISNFQTGTLISSDRREAAATLANTFVTAHQRIESDAAKSKKAEIQQRLLDAIPSLIELLGGPPDRTKQALSATGDNLRSTDFRRVMFSLVDQHTNRIKGVVDCRDPSQPDIAMMTDYPLDVEMDEYGNYRFKDIQQACVLECRTMRVPCAKDDSLVNQPVREAANLQAFVLVPVKHDGKVIGTVHIERHHGEIPSDEYVEAIEAFAEQVGKAIDFTTWADAIESLAHEETDQVMLLDLSQNLRFANEAAANALELPLGWQDRSVSAATCLDKRTREILGKAIRSGAKLARISAADRQDSPLTVVQASPIQDWRGAVCGLSLRIQDFGHLTRLLNALHEFARCNELSALTSSVLAVLRDLGHGWARIYHIETEDRMLGVDQYGLPEGAAGAVAFANGTAILQRRNASEPMWKALEDSKTTVYSHDTKLTFDTVHKTSTGLEVYNVQDTHCPSYLTKKNGERWIDLPLFSSGSERVPLGKMSVECPTDMTPERLKYLQVLAEAAGAAYAALETTEAREIELSARRRTEMLRAIGETIHQLQSKIVALSTLSEDLKRPQPDVPAYVVNLTTRLAEIQETIERTKERLKPLRCEPHSTDLRQAVPEMFTNVLPKGRFSLMGDKTRLEADIDQTLFAEAVHELALNSRKAVNDERPLQMSAHILSFSRNGLPWARIDVRDNGPGIPIDQLNLVFNEFYSNWPNADATGTGLGLAYVRSILAAHGGRVQAIESQDGACFRMEFPREFRENPFLYPKSNERQRD